MSWKTGCYIHTGLSGLQCSASRGPRHRQVLRQHLHEQLREVSVGSMKHAVMCNDEGLVATHGILQRNTEEEYRWFAAGPWPMYRLARPFPL